VIYGSVCSGIEAASVAWHPLGWRAAFLSEIEAFPRAVLHHHWSSVPLHGDFTTIQAGEYEPIELLVGGTPCQSFSVAGLRGGLADDRGNLALQFLKLADRLRPRWVVWENVPGVLSSNGGRDFGAILGGLVELGYGFAYRVLDAQFFGVPQRRRRVFVVGCLGDWRRAAAVLFERHSLSGHPAPSRQTGQGTAGGPGVGATSGFRESGQGWWTEGEFSLRADPGGMPANVVTHSLRADGFDASEDGTGRGTPIIAFNPTGGTHGVSEGYDISPTLKVGSGLGIPSCPAITVPTLVSEGDAHSGFRDEKGLVPVAFQEAQTGVREYDSAGSLRANGPGHDPVGTRIREGMAVRRLTPRECERLQGFPDDYTQVPYRGKPAADGPRYKALGNSMAVPVMRWIGQRIELVDAIRDVEVAA
jgi:DNA (cytosine-5)-methyltransferase 1